MNATLNRMIQTLQITTLRNTKIVDYDENEVNFFIL